MPPFTKKAIIDSFLTLAAKKNFDKITVRDIVDDCGINRTTFYYYYQDIYAILEELIDHFFDEIATEPQNIKYWEEAIEELIAFSIHNKRAIRNIYTSLGYDEFDRYISKAGSQYMREFILSRAGSPRKISDQELVLAELIVRKAIVGLFSEWIKQDFRQDIVPCESEIILGINKCAEMAIEMFIKDE